MNMDFNFEINLWIVKFGFKKSLDKFSSKKLSNKNRKLIWAKYEPNFELHLKEMELIFTDCFEELKNSLTDKDNQQTKILLSKFENNINWDLTENFDKIFEDLKSNPWIMFLWNQFFYTKEMKKLIKNMNNISDNFFSILITEINNYYTSWKNVDIWLLEKEKSEFIKLFIYSIHKFEKLILEWLETIFKSSLLNQMKQWNQIEQEKNEKFVKAIQKLALDIEKWSMNKYYNRLELVTNKILMDLILKLKK